MAFVIFEGFLMSANIDITDQKQIQELHALAQQKGSLENFDKEVFSELAQAALRIGENDNARVLMETVVHLEPEYDQGWVLLGRIHEYCANIDGAIASYEKAIELNADGRTILAIASLYINRKDYSTARQWLKHILDQTLKARQDGAFVQASALWERLDNMEG
ncbi:MAG: hypothetical protein CMH60_03180 [Myxococcales bacterium]|nr:hypothetical protein [Myxococcales bacterium]